MTWQPIQTAPKDQRIRVWSTIYGGRETYASWNPENYSTHPRPFWSLECAAGNHTASRSHQPTHWQPVDDPPDSREVYIERTAQRLQQRRESAGA